MESGVGRRGSRSGEDSELLGGGGVEPPLYTPKGATPFLRHSPSPQSDSDTSCSVTGHTALDSPEVCRNSSRVLMSRTRLLTACLLTALGLLLVKQWHDSQFALESPWFSLSSRGAGRPLASGEDQLVQRLPQCIVIGVRKCGTRALLEFLNLHPQIRIASDEVHFFDKDERYSQGLEWYRSQMPRSHPEQVTMEKSPAYFISEQAPGRIHHMNSSTQLLLILRDPITRILSDYTQVYTKRRSRNQTHAPLEELVIDSHTGGVNLDYKPVQISLYHKHWVRWTATFQRHQIHIVDGDRLIKDPLPELLRVEQFLHLQPFLSHTHFYFNETRGFYCMRNTSQQQRCLGSSKGRPHPDINTSVMAKLRDFYKAHNRLFYDLAGTNFKWDT